MKLHLVSLAILTMCGHSCYSLFCSSGACVLKTSWTVLTYSHTQLQHCCVWRQY